MNIDNCAFHGTNESKDNLSDNESDDDNNVNYLADNWKWDQWEHIGTDDYISEPIQTEDYNGYHGLKPIVAQSFDTALQCIF